MEELNFGAGREEDDDKRQRLPEPKSKGRKAQESVVCEILHNSDRTAALQDGWWRPRFTGEAPGSESTSKSGMEFEARSLCPVPFQAIMHEGGLGSRMFCVGA